MEHVYKSKTKPLYFYLFLFLIFKIKFLANKNDKFARNFIRNNSFLHTY